MKILILSILITGCGTFNISAPVTTPGSKTPTTTEDGNSSSVTAAKPVVVESATWINPDNGVTWKLIANAVTYGDAICPPSFILPQTTIPTKFADYLLTKSIPAGGTYWTSIGGTVGHITRSVESDGVNIFDALDTSKHLLICTE